MSASCAGRGDRDPEACRREVELVFSRHPGIGRFRWFVALWMRTDPFTSTVIRLAWEDRTTFEEIEERTGLTEAAVIRIMRRELKPASFRLWRKRVSGRITKHRKRFKREVLKRGRVEGENLE